MDPERPAEVRLGGARHRFGVWCRWVRWSADRESKNLLRSMVEKHVVVILEHWKRGLINAFMEGLDSFFSATPRNARDYGSTTRLIAKLHRPLSCFP